MNPQQLCEMLDIAYTPMHTWPMTTTAQINGYDIVNEQTHRGATIQTQRNGYFVVIQNGERQGGFVSVEEARCFIGGGPFPMPRSNA